MKIAGCQRNGPFQESNALRLDFFDWLVVAIITAVVSLGLPPLWTVFEGFEPDDTYRIPYALSEDYWHFARYARAAAKENGVIVLGDSVVWGRFASLEQTLSSNLKTETGLSFWNLGINGLHPVAMNGLLRYHVRSLRDCDILLHFNPLWISSPQYDLSTERETRFNHPKLVPQFLPRIPCYHESADAKADIAAERYAPLRSFASHLSIAYYDNKTPPVWTLDRPYECPLEPLWQEMPAPDILPGEDFRSWKERDMAPQPFEWVSLDNSLQWRFFCQTALHLRSRGNNVFVLVGPFNKHAVAQVSLDSYKATIAAVQKWLVAEGFPCHLASVLPVNLYADASHPIGQGYTHITRELLSQEHFQMFLGNAGSRQEEKASKSYCTNIQTVHTPSAGGK